MTWKNSSATSASSPASSTFSSVTPDVTWPSMSATRPRWPTCARMYGELQQTRDLLKAARAEIDDLKAALAEANANPLPGREVPLYDIRRDSNKRGAPYDRYFEDTIAPAMLNTGSTPEQINEILRKPKLNIHHTIPSHIRPHTRCTHTFRRAVRTAVLRTLRVAY